MSTVRRTEDIGSSEEALREGDAAFIRFMRKSKNSKTHLFGQVKGRSLNGHAQ